MSTNTTIVKKSEKEEQADACVKGFIMSKTMYDNNVMKHDAKKKQIEKKLYDLEKNINDYRNRINLCDINDDQCSIEQNAPTCWSSIMGKALLENAKQECKREFGNLAKPAPNPDPRKLLTHSKYGQLGCGWSFERVVCKIPNEAQKIYLKNILNQLESEQKIIQHELSDHVGSPPKFTPPTCQICNNVANCVDVKECKNIIQTCQQDIKKDEKIKSEDESRKKAQEKADEELKIKLLSDAEKIKEKSIEKQTDKPPSDPLKKDNTKIYLIIGSSIIVLLILIIITVMLMKK